MNKIISDLAFIIEHTGKISKAELEENDIPELIFMLEKTRD